MLGGEKRKHGRLGGPSVYAGQPARTPALRTARPWRGSLAGLLCAGLTGLLLGATFWLVPDLQEWTGSAAPWLAPAGDQQGVQARQCTSLALDRRKGLTTAEPCLREALPLREARAAAVGDRSLP